MNIAIHPLLEYGQTEEEYERWKLHFLFPTQYSISRTHSKIEFFSLILSKLLRLLKSAYPLPSIVIEPREDHPKVAALILTIMLLYLGLLLTDISPTVRTTKKCNTLRELDEQICEIGFTLTKINEALDKHSPADIIDFLGELGRDISEATETSGDRTISTVFEQLGKYLFGSRTERGAQEASEKLQNYINGIKKKLISVRREGISITSLVPKLFRLVVDTIDTIYKAIETCEDVNELKIAFERINMVRGSMLLTLYNILREVSQPPLNDILTPAMSLLAYKLRER